MTAPNQDSTRGLPVLALGFRPFFLLAGAWALLGIAIWLAMLSGHIPQPSHLAGTAWHGHEMLFGYVGAVIAGFLLTAVRNWTGMPTPTGAGLAGLVAIWAAGRIAPWVGLPPLLTAGLDLAFFPALALGLWRPLWQGPNPVNRVFLVLLAGMTTANALVHLGALGMVPGGTVVGDRLMLDLLLIIILLVGGRVMPFFIQQGIAGAEPKVYRRAEPAVFVVAAALLAADLVQPLGKAAGGLAIALGLLQCIRLVGWHHRRIWSTPMLTVLYLGFMWLALGLILDGLPAFSGLPQRAALHSLTVGAIGVLTLGMMARVAVGHTGRPMQASRLTQVAFVLINAAAVLRGLGPVLIPAGYQTWLTSGGVCWIAAFGLYLWVHAPMLWSPRPDGRPG